WTQPAKEEIDNYFRTVRASLSATGADPAEVIDDLERHIQEEIQTSRLQTVTREDVRRIVGRLGLPESAYEGANGTAVLEKEPEPPGGGDKEEKPTVKRPGVWLLIFGVIAPFLVLLLEAFTHFCGSVFFDPIPTYGHVLLVALVPLANLVLWVEIRTGGADRWKQLAWMSGVTSGIALFYALRYSVMLLPAVIALLVFGLGLLPMVPLFSVIATIRIRNYLKQFVPEGRSLPRLFPAMLMGIALVFALDVPVLLTHTGMQMADSDSPAVRARGIQLLRTFGHNKTMLRVCYGQENDQIPFDVYRAILGRTVSSEEAKGIFYRVNGRPFNSVLPPGTFTSFGRYEALDRELTWDAGQGGDTVAGRVKGLSLSNSRIDGFFDAEGAAAYLEWTLEFKNISSWQREARAQIALPPGAVVSRLTLWVNGEEREAAFAGASEVRQAYKNVVVVQRRDPVLVTYAGPDRVMMQCFPVPSNGVMKVRLGMTAPLQLLDLSHGAVPAPYFLERNFSMREGFAHNLWLESKAPIEVGGKVLSSSRGADGKFQLRGGLSDANLSRFGGAIQVSLPPSTKETWATDKRQPGYVVRQSIGDVPAPQVKKVCVVLDGSVDMAAFQGEIVDAFQALPGEVEVTLFAAHDEDVEMISSRGDKVSREQMAKRIRNFKFSGGQDNVPALLQAWDMGAAEQGTILLWIHGSQPTASPACEQLRQRLDWHAQSVALLDLPVEAGPNLILERMDSKTPIRTIARLGSVKEDLSRLFTTWSAGSREYRVTRTHVLEKSAGELSKLQKATDHTVRLWAFGEALQRIRNRKQNEAVELAALYQLVTPVSGAVVLENKAQYEQAQLTPVDPNSVPVVPEPSTYVLFGLGLIIAMIYFRRRPGQSSTS
ncbi:MAG TPA: VIT domain-containing protein, partial [Candidatus Saccharimonadales bacterium]|nr:VIT domain-containing protein [Candidatus Saccharimonadales bacterium]